MYSVGNSVVDVWIMLVMGGIGYVLRKFDFDLAPVALGLVLSPMLELSAAPVAGDVRRRLSAFFSSARSRSPCSVLRLLLFLLGIEAARFQGQGLAREGGA